MKVTASFVILLFSYSLFGYVHNINSSGLATLWNQNKTNLNITVDVSGFSGSGAAAYSSLTSAINNWNSEISETGISITHQAGYGVGIVDGVNTVSFSSDLGSGVLGITLISYNADSNEIKEADIVFSSSDSVYIANVFRHELGHFLGLAHSEVMSSLMVYSAFASNSTVHSDDKSGVLALYNNNSARSAIVGTVEGVGATPVFGAHVQAISVKTGSVIAGGISNKGGSFEIKGLNADDNYYLYVSPTLYTAALPSFYANTKSNYCPGKYIGKFFTQCGASEKGRPQAISVGSSAAPKTVDVGVVTIGCDPGLNSDYVVAKINSATVTILDSTRGEYTASYVGFFYQAEMTAAYGTPDYFKIDLSSLAASSCPSSVYANCSVQVHLLNKQIGSPMQLRATLYPETAGSGTASVVSDGYVYGTLSATAADRVYILKVEAKSDTLNLSIPDEDTFRTTNPIYLLSVSIRNSSSLTTALQYETTANIEDNRSCLEAPYVYQLKSSTVLSSSVSASKKAGKSSADDQSMVACGSIDDKNFPPMNGGGFLVIFVIPLFFAIIKSNKVLS